MLKYEHILKLDKQQMFKSKSSKKKLLLLDGNMWYKSSTYFCKNAYLGQTSNLLVMLNYFFQHIFSIFLDKSCTK